MIDARTKLLALIGHPVAHSLSPLFQNAALEYLHLPFVYLAFDVLPERLGKVVEAFRVLEVTGFNVTVPHKEAICAYLDSLREEAQVLRSVNTVVNREGQLFGYNTDVSGFAQSLDDEGVEVSGKGFLLLGAGGVARSVLFVLAERRAGRVFITNRTKSRSESLAQWAEETLKFPCQVLDWFLGEHPEPLSKSSLPENLSTVSGIINATSLGLEGETLPIPWRAFSSLEVVIDIVYHRGGTPLVHEARKRGMKSFDGRRMLLYQGAKSFLLFTGIEAPLEVMEEALFRE